MIETFKGYEFDFHNVDYDDMKFTIETCEWAVSHLVEELFDKGNPSKSMVVHYFNAMCSALRMNGKDIENVKEERLGGEYDY